jgi:hypothetical protein
MLLNKSLLGLLCIVMAASSCKKNPKPIAQTTGRLLLRVAAAENKQVDKFEYNQEGQMVKAHYYNGPGMDTLYMDYTYKNNKLHKIMHNNAEFTEYFYSGDTLKKVEVNDFSNGITHYGTYNYRNGKLDVEQTYHLENGQWNLQMERTYEYDVKGNVQTINIYMGPNLLETIELTYNEHPDPLLALMQQKYRQGPGKMPRLAEKEIHYDGQGFEEWTTEHTYEYDTKGYPVKRETVSRNPDDSVIASATVFYSYNN